jgi:predicted TIM-barrel fold metal-dependent hydrolase
MASIDREAIIDPELPIIDPHHHVRDRPDDRYLFEDLRADLATGHNIVATVAIECEDMYRAYGPPEMRSVGETEFLVGIAAMFGSGRYGPTKVCAGIVGYTDLRLGRDAQPVLDAQNAASGGRLRGIRNIAAWHANEKLRTKRVAQEGLLHDGGFRQGVDLLAASNLVLDLWLYHSQLADLVAMASACPRTTIVLNHLGGPLGSGPYAGKRDEVFADWRSNLRDVAGCHNVICKIGGLGQRIVGLGLDGPPDRATSAELALAWQPYVETAIQYFGVDRCMFESNFPTDQVSCTYPVLWNTFKRITTGYSAPEKSALFSGTAARVYRLPDVSS